MREADLLEAIARAPSEDGPRLVYADWLSSNNDPRGELIVVQIELAKLGVRSLDAFIDWEETDRAKLERAANLLRRQAQLLAQHGAKWTDAALGGDGALALDAKRTTYERGFLSRLVLKKNELGALTSLDRLFGEAKHPPLRELEIEEASSADLDAIPKTLFGHLEGLALVAECQPTPALLRAVLAPPRDGTARRLTHLRIQICKGFDLTPIADHGDGLEALTMGRCEPISSDIFARLVQATCMKTLKELHLQVIDVFRNQDNLGAVFDRTLWPALERLTLNYVYLHEHSLDWMAKEGKAKWRAPKHVSLSSNNQLGSRGADAFLTHIDLTDLESLNLVACSIEDRTLERIAASPDLSKLQALRMGHYDHFTSKGLEALGQARAAVLSDLDVVLTKSAPLTEAAVDGILTRHRLRRVSIESPTRGWRVPTMPADPLRAFTTNERARDLRRIRLSGFAMGAEGLGAITESVNLRELRALSLDHCEVNDAGLGALTSGAFLRDVASFELTESAVNGTTATELAGRLGHCPLLQRVSLGWRDVYDVPDR